MTRPGKTSSGSWMWGFSSTMKGSPHFSLIVCKVSPSRTTYISSHGLFFCRCSTSSPLYSLSLESSQQLNTSISAMNKAQYQETFSAIAAVEETRPIFFFCLSLGLPLIPGFSKWYSMENFAVLNKIGKMGSFSIGGWSGCSVWRELRRFAHCGSWLRHLRERNT